MTTPERRRDLPEQARRAIRLIEAARRPLLVSHIRLDGDAIGSELALLHILTRRGAAPHVANDGAVPMMYRFLPGASAAGDSPRALTGGYDLIVLLDTSEWPRTGAMEKALPAGLPVVCIDHHPQSAPPPDWLWADATASATGEMVYDLARAAEWHVPPEAATCLYVAIITDTGRFSFPNTTARTLRIAAELIELGAEHVAAAERIYEENPRALTLLRAEVTAGTRFYAEGRIAVMSATMDLFKRFGIDPLDTQEMSDYPRAIAGVRVGVLLREMKGNKVKVSLRSRAGVNVDAVARAFGGGGHRQAAGAEVAGSIADVEKQVVAALLPVVAGEKIDESR